VHGSGLPRHDDIDTQDVAVIMMQQIRYRLVLLSYQTVVPNPYSQEGMAQMGFMDHTPMYDNANVEWRYSHNDANMDDGET
jgi:hypothetical protein